MIADLKQEVIRAALAIAGCLKSPINAPVLARMSQELQRLSEALSALQENAMRDPLVARFQLVEGRAVQPTQPLAVAGSTVYCRGCGFTYDTSNRLEAARHVTH